MKKILSNLVVFVKEDFELRSYLLLILFLSALITFNYSIDFEDSYLDNNHSDLEGWLKYFAFYLLVYLASMLLMRRNRYISKGLKQVKSYLLVFISIGFITAEINFNLHDLIFSQPISSHPYFNHKITLRISESLFFLLELIVLGVIIGKVKYNGFGLWSFQNNLKSYLYLLLFMVPLIGLASQQSDFIESYPQLKMKYFTLAEYWDYFKRYEPFYLLNFIRTEWIFRGFMVLAFMPLFGKRSVLLIAMLYCIFHFGKPMAECISSFFGAYLLGSIAYQTKSIWGGVLLHMGIALLMDVTALMVYFF